MTDSRWKLSPEELEEVESGHRELMRRQAQDVKPINMPVNSNDIRSPACLLGDTCEPESHSHSEFEALAGKRVSDIELTNNERQTRLFDIKAGDTPGQQVLFGDNDI